MEARLWSHLTDLAGWCPVSQMSRCIQASSSKCQSFKQFQSLLEVTGCERAIIPTENSWGTTGRIPSFILVIYSSHCGHGQAGKASLEECWRYLWSGSVRALGCSRRVRKDIATAAQCMQSNARNQYLQFVFLSCTQLHLLSELHADSAGINHPHRKHRVVKQRITNPNLIRVTRSQTVVNGPLLIMAVSQDRTKIEKVTVLFSTFLLKRPLWFGCWCDVEVCLYNTCTAMESMHELCQA